MSSEQDDPLTTTTTVDATFTEDLDDDDDSDHNPSGEEEAEEDEDVDLIDDDDDNDSTSSSAAAAVTIAVPGTTSTPPATISTPVNVSPLPRSDVVLDHQQNNLITNKRAVPLDESRRLFQRLWTDEDEIELLQGFLEYNNQRAVNNPYSHHHHHDTTAFYDQIKDKLQLDFNKNQLVEKLRRLKKKYRNVVSKISSGKEYVFKTAHDQITFDISSKIWNSEGGTILSTPVVYAADVSRFDDDETNNVSPNVNLSFNLNDQNGNGVMYANSLDKKVPVAPRSRKRSRSGGVKVEEKVSQPQSEPVGFGVGSSNVPNSVPNVVEETVKSCLLPLFKELLDGSRGGLRGLGLGGMNMDPLGLGIGGLMNLPFGDVNDEKWRKQHILELEVCSKRLELVQDQIKSQLEELKSMRR
uniref:probable transcription factor At3g04930 n=1 Tax=Erigeron canadensis TaxID=72917 RepID=UPI001CB91326|nr:probable transcription factor At3g04930 [Erigeron canadensis]